MSNKGMPVHIATKKSSPVPGPSPLVPAPTSQLEVAAQKFEAGQRRASASESEVGAVPPQSLEEVDAQKFEEVGPQKSEMQHQAIKAQNPSRAVDLQTWQAKGVAKKRVVDCHQMAAVGEFIILLLWLYFWITSARATGGKPAPGHSSHQQTPSTQLCSWNWRLFHCSTGCKIRMHLPGLQSSCTLYNVEEPA